MEGRALKPMQLTGNVGENWRQWKQKFEIYSAAIELDAKSEKTQCGQLLFQMGEEAIDIFNTFTFMDDQDDEKNKFVKLIEKFDDYFLSKKNITYERYKFFTARQDDKTIEEFVLALKDYAQDCDFPDHLFKTELIKIMLIVGIKDEKIREHLLHEEYTLDKAVAVCNLMQLQNKLDLPNQANTNVSDDENVNLEGSAQKQCEKELNIAKRVKYDSNENKDEMWEMAIPRGRIIKARPYATFRFTVPQLSKLKNVILSPACYVRNLPWTITISRKYSMKTLSVGVQCAPRLSPSWSCYAGIELRLLPVRINTKIISHRFENLFNDQVKHWLFRSYIKWDEVINTRKGYINNDTITLEMIIQANAPRGLNEIP